MSNIDERVVRMEFDNDRFERNIKTTQNSLDRLKSKLNFGKSVKGLSELERAGNSFSMNNMMSVISSVSNRFSNMGIVGMTVIQNLTNSAVNAAKRMVKALSIDQVSAGFKEYELKMGSTQTIIASTGESLSTVNKYLQELNTYSDKTIYSFADMTQNIGKFTNAGVKLKDAVSAIKGISNEAAVSGANAQEASRAMYNFAQALSAGSVKLIDWKSIENANMATVEFKQQLLDTAEALGTVKKTEEGYISTTKNLNGKVSQAFSTTKGFNESLSHQWMTTDVLVQTLAKYSDETTEIGKKAYAAAQDIKTFTQLMDTLKEAVGSGWAETWQLIFGDLNQAKELWTSVSNSVGAFISVVSDARNSFLTKSLTSSWRQFLDIGVDDASSFEEEIANVARESGVAIDKMIEDNGSFEKTLRSNWLTTDILTRSMGSYLLKLHEMSDEEKESAGITDELIDRYDDMFASIKTGKISLDDFVNSFSKLSGRENIIEGIKNTFKSLLTYLQPIKDAFGEIFDFSIDDIAKSFYDITENFKNVSSVFEISSENAENLKETFKGIFSIFDMGHKVISNVLSGFKMFSGTFEIIASSILKVTAAIGKFFTGLNESEEKTNFIGSSLHDLFSWLSTGAETALSSMVSAFRKAFDVISNFIETHSADIEEAVSSITSNFDISDLVGLLTAGGLGTVALNVSNLFHDLGETLEAFQKKIKAPNLVAIATAIGILAGAFFVLSTIKPEKIMTAMAGLGSSVGTLLLGISGLSKIMATIDFKGFSKIGRAMVSLAFSTLILSAAMKVLSTIEWDDIAKGLISVVVLFAAMSKTVKSLDGIQGGIKKVSSGLISMAIAMIGMAAAVKIFSTLNITELAKGIGSIAAILLVIAGYSAIMSKSNLTASAAGLIGIAAAMVIFSGAVMILGNLSLPELAKGIGGMTVALYAVAGASHLLKGTIGGAVSLVVMASGIVILTTALIALSAVKPEKLGTAILALVGALAVLGLAGALLGPVAPAMLAVAGAVALLGVGVFAAGAGIAAFAAGFTMLAGAVVTGAAGIVAGLTTLVTGLVTILPIAATALAGAITMFIVTLANGAADIATAVAKLVVALVSALATAIPQIVSMGIEFVVTLFTTISDNAGMIIGAGVQMIGSLIIGLANALPQLIAAGIYLVVSFINSVANGIRDNSAAIMAAVQNLVSSIVELALTGLQALVSMIPGVGDEMAAGLETAKEKVRETLAPENMQQMGADAMAGIEQGFAVDTSSFAQQGSAGIDSYVTGMNDNLFKVEDAGQSIGEKGSVGASSKSDIFKTAGIKDANSFISGINNKKSASNSAGVGLASEGSSGAGSKTDDFIASGENGGQGFVNGLRSKITLSYNAGYDLGAEAKRGADNGLKNGSPSKLMKRSGAFGGEGFVIGLRSFIDRSRIAGEQLGHASVKGLNTSVSTINNILNNGIHSPVITPVVDLSKTKDGIKHINSMFSNARVNSIVADNSNASTQPVTEVKKDTNIAYNFTQNNYSPKALSRIDIYRQTKNQFTALKGVRL